MAAGVTSACCRAFWHRCAGCQDGTAALALAIFVPKCCDIGAYFTGRLLGRHQMTPVLSPKKTWEGRRGRIGVRGADRGLSSTASGRPVLRENLALEIGFGLSVGLPACWATWPSR